MGNILWVLTALIGSLANAIVLYIYINQLPGFKATINDIFIVTSILIVPALLLTFPPALIIRLIARKNIQTQKQFLLSNTVLIGYSIGLSVALQPLMSDLEEVIALVLPYTILAFICANYYIYHTNLR